MVQNQVTQNREPNKLVKLKYFEFSAIAEILVT